MALLLTNVGTILLAADVLPAPPVAAVNIIYDTDMGDDCDDVGALFILHGAVERGEAKLLATMGCISSDAIPLPWMQSTPGLAARRFPWAL